MFFPANEDLLNYKNVYIVFDGVDTFASIVLNNETIGNTDNMFTRYIFDIKPKLKVSEDVMLLLKLIVFILS